MTGTAKIISFFTAAVLLFALDENLNAVGNFSMGINTGATYDPNNLEDEINDYNAEIEYQNANVNGTKGDKMAVPYAYLLGASFRYQFNFLLFRLGGHFAKPFTDIEGSFTSAAGDKNKIKISTYQASFPLSIGFLLPVRERAWFYFGGGFTYHMASVKITQSNPSAGPFSGGDRRDSYFANFPGWHLIAGAEVPLSERYSISLEWIHQEGRSYPVSNDGLDSGGASTGSPKYVINSRGDFILFGINYYISI